MREWVNQLLLAKHTYPTVNPPFALPANHRLARVELPEFALRESELLALLRLVLPLVVARLPSVLLEGRPDSLAEIVNRGIVGSAEADDGNHA